MLPYIHLGSLTIPTFGLMVALALITAAYVLNADFLRRGFHADAFAMITVAGICGILGAKLYHLLETPAEFFANPGPLFFSRFGFAWFGGFLGGFGAMLVLGWRAKLPVWEFLDSCTPAAAVGYAIGRIGCLLSGDGDYGRATSLPWGMSFPNGVVPTTERVHPAPLYEFIVWMLIGWLLWRLGARLMKQSNAAGRLFALYLLLTGIARYLVEIIRINPREYWGMSNAQVASLASVAGGLILLVYLRTQAARQ